MSLPQSVGFQLVGKVVAAFASAPDLIGLPVVRNPRRPQDLSVGTRVIIVAESSDKQISKAGNRETRVRSFSVGALSRLEGADADADALAELVSNVTHAALVAMAATAEITRMTEASVQFHVDDLEVDGAIVVSGWEIQYTRKRETV
jgi:hypothetical protein